MTETDAGERSGVKSALRVLTILEFFADAGSALTFTEKARHFDYPCSSLHGLLRTLSGRGWLMYDAATRRYSLDARVVVQPREAEPSVTAES